MSKKTILLPILCAVSLTLAGCAADGQRYRADTYSTSGVNRAQEVTTVEILAINPAKVAVDNSSAGSRARTTGAILGAIAGALVGQAVDSNTHNTLVGAGTGGGRPCGRRRFGVGLDLVRRRRAADLQDERRAHVPVHAGRSALRIQDGHRDPRRAHARRNPHSAEQPLRLPEVRSQEGFEN